jgi:D-alanine-D-alanine ligase
MGKKLRIGVVFGGRSAEHAVRAFQALCCEGMARVDMFVEKGGRILVNEINTIPGFTRISMYPKLWEASGISYSELIDRLIELAIDRFQTEQGLATSPDENAPQSALK